MTERAERIKQALIAGGDELIAMWRQEFGDNAELRMIKPEEAYGLADLNRMIEQQPAGSYGRRLAEAARDSILAEGEEWWLKHRSPSLVGLCKERGLELHKAGAVAK
jgi:hypothetical protein